MPVMLHRIEAVRFVALGAERIALCNQLARMHVVTVAAGDTVKIHPALQKRTHDKHLVVDLAVCKIKSLVEQGQPILIMVIAIGTAICERRTARVATTAGLDSRIADAARG